MVPRVLDHWSRIPSCKVHWIGTRKIPLEKGEASLQIITWGVPCHIAALECLPRTTCAHQLEVFKVGVIPMSAVPRLMICPSSTTCLVRRHGSFWCLLLQILMISWMSWGVEVDVDCLGGSYIFHHVWNIFLCRSWKLMYDDVCRYSVPYLCCKFVYSFLQCALHEDLNMPIICHYRGCFQYTVHSDLVQPLSAAALSSNLEKQVMTHASHRFIARQCTVYLCTLVSHEDGMLVCLNEWAWMVLYLLLSKLSFHQILSKAFSETELSRFLSNK